MNKDQGFVGILMAVAVAILIGGGAYVVSNQTKVDSTSIVTESEKASIVTEPVAEQKSNAKVSVEIPTSKPGVTVKLEGSPEDIQQLRDEAELKAADAARKAALSSARLNAEVYYGTTGNYSYGAQGAQKDTCTGQGAPAVYVSAGMASAFSIAPGVEFKCNVSADGKAHAAWVKLATSGYYCVDSRGASKYLTAEPTSGATACS